jgi:GNAT superfamily N-acetyltransferase
LNVRLRIREPQPGDGAGMARIWVMAGEYYAELDPELFQVPSDEGLTERFDRSIVDERAEHALQLVAEEGGRIVGMIAARLEDPVDNPEMQLVRYLGRRLVVVDLLIVDRSRWREGIGTRLMEEIERWGRERGAALARLDTFVQSRVSMPFYERHLGYRRRSVIFEKPL